MGRASVPSGASTGEHEALELRDGDKTRYGEMCIRDRMIRQIPTNRHNDAHRADSNGFHWDHAVDVYKRQVVFLIFVRLITIIIHRK